MFKCDLTLIIYAALGIPPPKKKKEKKKKEKKKKRNRIRYWKPGMNYNLIIFVCQIHLDSFSSWKIEIQWNPSIKATQDDGLSKEVACHEG